MIRLETVFRQKQDIVVRNIGNESVIVPLRNKVAEMDILYTLNETGAFIWGQVDGRNDVAGIIGLLMNEFSVDEEVAKRDVVELLGQMNGKVIEPV